MAFWVGYAYSWRRGHWSCQADQKVGILFIFLLWHLILVESENSFYNVDEGFEGDKDDEQHIYSSI